MKYRTLGPDLKVSAIGIGCMPMIRDGNITYGHATKDESIATIHEAIDRGVTFLDTAEMYGPFSNEELVGEAIRGKREGLVIATKFAMTWNGDQMAGLDGSPANARRACEGSLKRLGIDTIDLFYQHRVDPKVPIEETVGGMAELVKEGKVRHIALSEAGPETLRRAAGTATITALQSEYSLWERDVEDEILSICREHGIGFVPYSPLGRGFLAGGIRSLDDLAPDDWRRNDPRYSAENMPSNLAVVDAVAKVAAAHGVSNARVALAWLLAQGEDIVPIPGVMRRETMRDSAGAPDVTLSADDLAVLDIAAPRGGNRGSALCRAGHEDGAHLGSRLQACEVRSANLARVSRPATRAPRSDPAPYPRRPAGKRDMRPSRGEPYDDAACPVVRAEAAEPRASGGDCGERPIAGPGFPRAPEVGLLPPLLRVLRAGAGQRQHQDRERHHDVGRIGEDGDVAQAPQCERPHHRVPRDREHAARVGNGLVPAGGIGKRGVADQRSHQQHARDQHCGSHDRPQHIAHRPQQRFHRCSAIRQREPHQRHQRNQ